MLPLAWCRWGVIVHRYWSHFPRRDPQLRRRLGFVVLAVASLAALGTPPQRHAYSFGMVFDVAADPGGSDTFYASLATRRIIKCGKRGTYEADACVIEAEAEHTVEVYRSQDGGRSWAHYAPVGGYLWTDPHTPGRLYALNEDGLHRLEDGQAHLLDVPFEAAQVALFYYDAYDAVGVPPSEHALTFDPITPGLLYLADGRRILTSADGGQSWRSLVVDGASGRVKALAVAPSEPQTLYAAASDRVLRSDDGGSTWSSGATLSGGAPIRALAVHPATPDIVYAAGKGIFRSTDGGRRWQHVYQDSSELQTIVFGPADADLIYAAGYAVIFSADGGDTWSRYDRWGWDVAASPVAPHRVILALGTQGVAVQESPPPLPTPTPPLGLAPSHLPAIVYADALAVEPGDLVTLYALTTHPPALGRSDDDGATWTIHPLADTADDPPIALASRSIAPAYSLGPTSLVSPTHSVTATYPTSPTEKLLPLVALGQKTVYHLNWHEDGVDIERFSLPALTSTTSLSIDLQSEITLTSRTLLVAPSDPNLLLTSGPGGVLRSADGGQTWTTHVFSPTGGLGWPTALAIAPTQAVTPAISPTRTLTGTLEVQPTIQNRPVTIYAAANAEDDDTQGQIIFRSRDGGVSWKPRAWLTETQRLSFLAVHPADPEIVYGGSAGLYQSGDGGVNWLPLFPDMTVHSLAQVPDDPRLLYAITDGGVARSDDGGLTWTLICPAGQINGPAEFLDVAVASFEPYPVILLARPSRPDLSLPSPGICQGSPGPRYDLGQGWQPSKEGLPVFITEYRGG